MLPQALQFGMTDTQFWYEEPYLFVAYAKSYGQRRQQELDEWQQKTNIVAWINGIYIQNAIASVLSKDCKYPQKPIEFFAAKTNVEEQKTAQETLEEQIRKRSQQIDDMLKQK